MEFRQELRPPALAIISNIWVQSVPFGIYTYLLDPPLLFYPIANRSSWNLEFVRCFLLGWLGEFAFVLEGNLLMLEIVKNMNFLPLTICLLY